jgi:hypothetical protein
MADYQYPGDDGLPDGPLNWWTRWRLRAPHWPFLLAAVLFGGYYFWKYRSPAVAMSEWTQIKDTDIAALFFGMLALIRGVQVLLRYSAELEYRAPHQIRRFRSWCLPWLFLIAVVIYFGIGENWPLRVSFWWSRSALDRVANEALADPDHAYLLAGKGAGLYRVAGVEVSGKSVAISVEQGNHTSGFVRAPTKPTDTPYINFSEDADEGWGAKWIKDDWFVIYPMQSWCANK